MIQSKKEKRIDEILFYICWIPYLAIMLLRFSVLFKYIELDYLPGFMWFLFAVLTLRMFLFHTTSMLREHIIWTVVCYVLFAWSWILGISDLWKMIALMILLIHAATELDMERFLTITLTELILLLGVVLIACAAGVIPNFTIGEGTDRLRYCLGFTYPLYPSTVLANIMMLAYLKKSKVWNISIAVLGSIANWIFYQLTDSRLNFMFCIALAVLMILSSVDGIRKIVVKCRILLIPISAAYIGCSGISLYFAKYYNPEVPWMNKLNRMLGTRLSLAKRSIQEQGFHLGVKHVGWTGGGLDLNGNVASAEYNYVDNMYIQLFQRYGIVFFVIAILGLTCLMLIAYKKGMYRLILILAMIAAHLLIDDLFFYVEMNGVWLLLGMILAAEPMKRYEKQSAMAAERSAAKEAASLRAYQ